MLQCPTVQHQDTMARAGRRAPSYAALLLSIAHQLSEQAAGAAMCCCKGRQRLLLVIMHRHSAGLNASFCRTSVSGGGALLKASDSLQGWQDMLLTPHSTSASHELCCTCPTEDVMGATLQLTGLAA